MQFNYQGHSLKSGIYKLTNTANNRFYIGSCREFKERWKQHAKGLEQGKHTNTFLLNDFNKCGANSFVFEVLELMDGASKEERLAKEQFYLDQLYDNQCQCYNIRKEAVSREGCKDSNPEAARKRRSDASKKLMEDPVYKQQAIDNMRKSWDGNHSPMLGRLHSTNTKQRMSLAQSGKPKSVETKQRMSAAQKLVDRSTRKPTVHTDETKHKMSLSNWQRKKVLVTCIATGESTTFDTITEARQSLNLSKAPVERVLRGDQTQTKGYSIQYLQQ